MRVIIAEKPEVAEAIAGFLARKTGLLKQMKGVAYIVGDDVVIQADGHLYLDYMPEDYDPIYESRTFEMLPIIPENWKKKRREDERARRSFAALDEFLPKATRVLHACDVDPDGQLIGDEIIRYFKVTAPVDRLPVNAYDDADLKEAFDNIRSNDEFRSLTAAAAVRSRNDWLVGMNASTLLKLSAAKEGHKGRFAAGRVISPTLYLLAQLEKRILTHKSLRHYIIRAEIHIEDEVVAADWVPPDPEANGFDPQGRLVRPALAQAVVDRVLTTRTGRIADVQIKENRFQPPLPFSLAPLQVAAGKEYGYSATQVQEAANALYKRHFLISYPRANCRYLKTSQHETAPAVLECIKANIPSLAGVVDRADTGRISAAFDDSKVDPLLVAHTAIRPLMAKKDIGTLSTIERDVYELIARNFIAQFYPPAIVIGRTIQFVFGADTFETNVSSVTDMGWRTVMGFDDRGAGIMFDSLVGGMTARIAHAASLPQDTPAPRRLHDYDLIARLNDVGRLVEDEAIKAEIGPQARLGTEATQTGVINNLIEYKYIHRNDRGLLFVLPLGIAVADALPDDLRNPIMTTRWERELAEIARGSGNAGTFYRDQVTVVREMVKKPVRVFFDKQWKTASESAGNPKGGAARSKGNANNRGGGERSVA